MVRDLITRIFNIDYDTFFSHFVEKITGPTGAQIISWSCLILATFLLLRRRVTAAGLIVFLYAVAFVFAYIPSILKLLKGA